MDVQWLENKLIGKTEEQILVELTKIFPGQVVFSTSFQLEDQVITHMIFSKDIDIDVFTIDTGRLFPETYKTWQKTLEKYNKKIIAYFPDYKDIEKLLTEKGPFSFYQSVENRKECCYLRKVKPLERALRDRKCWITGLRSGQSETRENVPLVHWDKKHGVYKVNPLHDWTLEQVRDYIKRHLIPYNELQDKGFLSVGCQPCTRAVKPGESIRAGRWWWENNSEKECGLHVEDEDYSSAVKINLSQFSSKTKNNEQ